VEVAASTRTVGGYYLSPSNEVIEDRVSVVYSDFPMNWNKQLERTAVLNYCATLRTFLLDKLWEEEILIGAYTFSHVLQ
jgi:hypothetical protein